MYGCESWMIKKAECRRIDAFELWCWRRLLRVPWTARRSNQSILKEISPEYSFEGWMLKLKLQYFGYLMWRTYLLERPWCWERLNTGEKGVDRGWDNYIAPSTDGHVFEQAPGVGDGQGSLACCSPWDCKSRTRLSDWTEYFIYFTKCLSFSSCQIIIMLQEYLSE